MSPKLKSAEHLENYKIGLTYDDGGEGNIDLEKELRGEVFEPLKDVSVFKSFRIKAELSTIVWPYGADSAPDYLHVQASA